jgi:hypothetical protein
VQARITSRERAEPATAADANWRVLDCGRDKQVDAFQSNQLWLVSVAFMPKVTHQDAGMPEGFAVSKSLFGQAALPLKGA